MRLDPFLRIIVYIVFGDKTTDLNNRARVLTSLYPIDLFLINYETTECFVLFCWEIIALTTVRVPNLNMLVVDVSPQDEEALSIGKSLADHQK